MFTRSIGRSGRLLVLTVALAAALALPAAVSADTTASSTIYPRPATAPRSS